MRARTLLFPAALLALLSVVATPLAAQQTVESPLGAIFQGLSADGSRVVGRWNGEACFWDWRDDPAPTPIGGKSATAVSDDGSVIVGDIDDPISGLSVAARWTAATGWVPLGGLDACGSLSGARDVSGDGTKVVGLAWDGCSGRAFVWSTTNGLELLQPLSGSNNALSISGDGTTVGGYGQGLAGRTPATWETANLNGQVLDVNVQGEIKGLDADGSVAVGTRWFNGGTYTAFKYSGSTGWQDLGSLDPGWAATAVDVSEAGDVVVGFDSLLLSRVPWLWRPSTGIEALHDVLLDLAIHPGHELYDCVAVSDDGRVVVSHAGWTGLPALSLISELEPQPQVWTDLGGDTNGINGHPHLSGTGTLVAGTPTSIDLVNGPTSALSVCWVSLSSVPFPVAGGTLYANPYVSEFLIPLNGSGEFHAAFPWFAGVPSGLSLHFQFIIQDLSRVWGFSLSNGLKASMP